MSSYALEETLIVTESAKWNTYASNASVGIKSNNINIGCHTTGMIAFWPPNTAFGCACASISGFGRCNCNITNGIASARNDLFVHRNHNLALSNIASI